MDNSRHKPNSSQEIILVVKKNELVASENFYGIFPASVDLIFEIISTQGLFIKRELAEYDESFKQIIPYLVYQYKDSFFLMQRSNTTTEDRLKNCYSLGIGGHIKETDLQDSQSILDWAQREFAEEVFFSGSYKPIFLGLLNDDSTPVGRVHLGLVFLLKGSSPNISVRSELKSGKLIPLKELGDFKDEMENWSKIVLDHLNVVFGQKTEGKIKRHQQI
jgi:predicted NUDIX family phosphoesterase